MSALRWTSRAKASLLAGLAFALCLPCARAQEKPKGAVQDVAFFGGNRPVLLRVHVVRNSKSLSVNRDEYIKRWFDFLDRDGDGVLNEAEMRVVPTPQMLRQLRVNGVAFFNPTLVQPNRAALAQLDADRDGRVTLAELTTYFERAGFRPISVVNNGPPQDFYDRPSEVLFQHLDGKKQGKLSKEGVRQAADAVVRKLDSNDDEMVGPEELVPNLGNNFAFGAQLPVLPGRQPTRGPTRGAFYGITSAGRDQQLALLLVSYFSKKKAFQVTQAESGLDQATFNRLDKDRNGILDVDELAYWHQRPADVELVVRLNPRRGGRGGVELLSPREKLDGVEQTADGALRLKFGDAKVSIRPPEASTIIRVGNSRILIQVFQFADTKKNGYLTREDLTGRAQVLRPLFALADRNGDGKMTIGELTALANLLEDAPLSFVDLSVAEHGRALFQLLDTNRDGRLSLRELRSAWDRLGPLDKNGDGLIAADEVPRQFEITVGQGQRTGLRPPAGVQVRLLPTTPARVPTRGPLWFRKMDLNGDGDVSPREFLGTAEEFRRIDSDGDGLISVEEAEAFDVRTRAKEARGR